MSDRIIYAFEELSDDLPRPPLVAVRALLGSGIIPSPRGWASLPVETRVAIARHGLVGVVDISAVRELAQQIPPRYLKLVSRTQDPNPDEVPAMVAKTLGPARPITDGEWRSLRAVDRAVLQSLAANSRLLARAYDELAPTMGKAVSIRQTRWSGAIAHCEIHLNDEALDKLASKSFLDGRAFMLARVAGIRAARRIAQTLDLHADSAAGPVELDGMVQYGHDRVLWQAHVSTWDGAFFPAAALLAATTAATAVFDMVKELDPGATIEGASIRDEAWRVGAGATDEEATQLYAPSGWKLADVDRESSPPASEGMSREPGPAAVDNRSNVGPPASAAVGSASVDSGSVGSGSVGSAMDLGTTVPDAPRTDSGAPQLGRASSRGTSQDIGSSVASTLEESGSVARGGVVGDQPLVALSPSPVLGSSPESTDSTTFPSTSGQPASDALERLSMPDGEEFGFGEPRARGPAALLVASLLILAVALAIFGYVLIRSV